MLNAHRQIAAVEGAASDRNPAGTEALLCKLKEIDIRKDILYQARHAVDNGVHIGGAYSAVTPLVCLFYTDVMNYRVEAPTSPDQDMFILSKGHAVAALAAIYADLGYFDRSVLKNSRSVASIFNGHPGPLLPGVPTATGPMGQGLSVALGLALAGRLEYPYDVYALVGDGELQEGTIWEAVMFAGSKGVDNLCMLVDANGGQLDDSEHLHLSTDRLGDRLRAFGWGVSEVDGRDPKEVLRALRAFRHEPRRAEPQAVICRTVKGYGGFSSVMKKHKAVLSKEVVDYETRQLNELRATLERVLAERLALCDEAATIPPETAAVAEVLNLSLSSESNGVHARPTPRAVRVQPAPARGKRMKEVSIPALESGRSYKSDEVVALAMRAYAADKRVISVDSDLASTSGLEAGVSARDMRRAINVGIAEANMMCIGEGLAVAGNNVWVSTFCPFFNLGVLRRIAISQAERLEVIEERGGWLTEGHGLDLTFLATAPNFETKTNGATHMGNDDIMMVAEMGCVRVVDVSCPNQLLGVVHWIMEGNRGLVYVRVMRGEAPLLYEKPEFSLGVSYRPRRPQQPQVIVVSSGRGVHEAVAAADALSGEGIAVEVVDMPSEDVDTLLELHDRRIPVLFAEQNNGYLLSRFRAAVFRQRDLVHAGHVHTVNTLDEAGRPRFIHSGTYEELADHYGLSASMLASRLKQIVAGGQAA